MGDEYFSFLFFFLNMDLPFEKGRGKKPKAIIVSLQNNLSFLQH